MDIIQNLILRVCQKLGSPGEEELTRADKPRKASYAGGSKKGISWAFIKETELHSLT